MPSRVLPHQSTPPQDLPSAASNEAEPEQLDIAQRQGDTYTYRDALPAMAEQDGAAIARTGQYLIALVNEQSEGMYELSEAGELKWREAPRRQTPILRSPSPALRTAPEQPPPPMPEHDQLVDSLSAAGRPLAGEAVVWPS